MVLVLNSILAYAIPDIPSNLKTQILRENQLKRELQYVHSDDEDDDDCDYENDFENVYTSNGETMEDANGSDESGLDVRNL